MANWKSPKFIKNRRLSMAGYEVLNSDQKIIDIAMKYGYDSPDSFTKAFKRFHGFTPNEVRNGGVTIKDFAPLKVNLILKGGYTMEYKIEEKNAFKVVGLKESFKYENAKQEEYDIGYKEGYGEGNYDGYADGYKDGLNEGKNSVYDTYYKEGYEDGYQEGYFDCEREYTTNETIDSPFLRNNTSNGENIFEDDIYDASVHESKNDAPIFKSLEEYTDNTSILKIVYITDSGTKYHRSGCRYLKDSCHSISIDNAEAEGYSPCSVCDP